MKIFLKKLNTTIIITMMLVLSFFCAETAKFWTNLNNLEPQKVINTHGLLAENVTKTTTQVNLGDYITLGKYNGKDIVWRCVSIDDSGTLMLADSIIDMLPYDAITSDNNRSKSHSRDYRRDTYGSNYWKDSNMRSWLNSMAEVGGVKWLCGNPPKENCVDGNAYDQKAGFLNNFSRA